MEHHLSTLRPVGNTILTSKTPLELSHFGNQDIRFYQSGTAALAACLIATKSLHNGRTKNPEIILPAYACPDLISACIFAGAIPVLVDFEPDSCWMSLDNIESVITKNTIGIIAVRFLGIAERMRQLEDICNRHNLTLIEDSAQGFPVRNPESYWQGDMAILSFGRGKPVNLLGGGAVLVRNPDLSDHFPDSNQDITLSLTEKLKYWLKVRAYNLLIKPLIYGIATQLPGLHIGETTYKKLAELNSIQAHTLEFLNANITHYKKQPNIAKMIHQRLSKLAHDEIIDLPVQTSHDLMDPLLRYPVLIKNEVLRDELYIALRPFGASTMYQTPLYLINGIPELITKDQSKMPNAENFSKRLLTLPTHRAVTDETLDHMADTFARIMR